MAPKVFDLSGAPVGPRVGFPRGLPILFPLGLFLLFFNPVVAIPAGHVGVTDFFGYVGNRALPAGLHFVVPMTRVHRMSIQTLEIKEVAEVPSQEGLIMSLEASLLFRLDPAKAPEVYRTVGRNYATIVVEPQIRSSLREITASYDAKVLYSAARDRLAREVAQKFEELTKERGIITEAVLLRKVALPEVVAGAIQEKLKREQEAEQMKFVLQKESQEAERKRIEAQGISDFQRIVAGGLSPMLLEWKGIEATEKLAQSPNTKVVVVGNPKNGLPLILGGEGR
jgi:regulator of protease activity HflC (stomatin/prohibitin superfamily)